MRSMTGMGVGRGGRSPRRVTVELRSVNNRFLDFSFRLPPGLGRFETQLRTWLSSGIERGRVSVNVELERGASKVELEIDEAYVGAWIEATRAIARKHKLVGAVEVAHVAALPEAFIRRETELPDAELLEMLESATTKALKQFNKMRDEEGKALKGELARRLTVVEKAHKELEERAESVAEELRHRLEARLEKMGARDHVDPQRLAAEVALLADRGTISEEVERLSSHLQQFRAALKAKGPQAKRLNFLLQEMHREVNTCGSKSSQIEITNVVLTMKEELENMREQVQNLE